MRRVTHIGLILCATFIVSTSPADAQYDAQTIIQRSVEANAKDWEAAPSYDYFERDQQPGGGTKTYEEIMILGSRYERLVAVNGKPLSADRQAEEQQKLQAVITQRQNESARERAERVAQFEKGRRRNRLFMEQLTKAFNFSFLGEQELDGHDVYVLKATPSSDYQPPNMEAEALLGMAGKLWIDKQAFQWVRVEAWVIRPVSIEGFLAQVEPGTRFELEKSPVEDDIWLPRHFAMKSRARIFFFFPHKTQADETYYGYHRVTPIQAKPLEK